MVGKIATPHRVAPVSYGETGGEDRSPGPSWEALMAMAGLFWIGEDSLYDVPVRSGARRPASVAFDAAYVMVTGAASCRPRSP
ncbi:hypothetical protein GCM10011428_29120 [Streptomyces violaceus]|uniref:hypothetical protein n=1 Tax=Streptomyces violaceus TaxID=1936 RepID=UPI0031EE9544